MKNTLRLEIVTPTAMVYLEDVNMVTVPGKKLSAAEVASVTAILAHSLAQLRIERGRRL